MTLEPLDPEAVPFEELEPVDPAELEPAEVTPWGEPLPRWEGDQP